MLTLASILGLVVSRKLGLRAEADGGERHATRCACTPGPVPEGQAVRLGEIGGLLATVAVSALVIELVIAVLLIPRMLIDGIPVGDAVLDSFYYSAMAFTNTGFTPNAAGPRRRSRTTTGSSALIMIGVFLGSIGFPVIYALARNPPHPRRWSLHVKLTLVTTPILLVLGTVALHRARVRQPDDVRHGNAAGTTVFQSLFLSTMTRSGGFSTIDIADLNGSSLLVTDMLMFIGGGSASTAGGIKVTTLAVLFLAAFAEARGQRRMEAFGRRIPSDVLRLAVSVVLWGATIVAVATHPDPADHQGAPRPRAVRGDLGLRHLRALSTGLTDSAARLRQVRPRRHDVDGPRWYSDTRRRPGRQPAPPAVHATRREAHRWLTGSSTTPPCSSSASAASAPRPPGQLERLGPRRARRRHRRRARAEVGRPRDARRAGRRPQHRRPPADRRAGLLDRGRRRRLVDRGERADHGQPRRPQGPADLGEGDQRSRTARSSPASAPTTSSTPRREAGERVAHLVSGRMLDYIEFDDDFAIVKMYPPKPVRGSPLAASNVRKKYGITDRRREEPRQALHRRDARDTVDQQPRPHHRVGRQSDLERFAR